MKTFKAWAILQPEGHVAAWGEPFDQYDIYEKREDAEKLAAEWHDTTGIIPRIVLVEIREVKMAVVS